MVLLLIVTGIWIVQDFGQLCLFEACYRVDLTNMAWLTRHL